MEYNNIEMNLIAQTELTNEEVQPRELNELELALIGGGSGDVSFT